MAQNTGNTSATGTNKQNSKITPATFLGDWRGEEKCQNIGAPVAAINISKKSETEVLITGIYSTTGEVMATIKGNTLSIPRQEIHDPIFLEMRIEGNLILSKDHQTLSGILLISNHDARDNCGAEYHR